MTLSIAMTSLFQATAILLLSLNIAATLVVAALGAWQGWAARRARGAAPPAPMNGAPPGLGPARIAPMVSIHVATHDEPPAMVIGTLRALAALEWPSFEVVVIDNNTADPATWRPVEAACAALGPRFRFVHRMGVTGAKAGALNIALGLTDRRARYVAIVDADYRVAPDFLRRAVAACSAGDTHFVQFPQDYRGLDAAGPVGRELAAYFHTFPAAANASDASLLTGTLSLIRIDALRGVGGWPTASITEDAALGVALWRTGARGRYVAGSAGQGLMPLDFAGLRLQRERWVAGNAQVLRELIGAVWRPRREPAAPSSAWRARRGLPAVVAQMTAWPAFLALPTLVLALLAVVALVTGSAPTGPVATLAAAALWIAIVAVLARGLAHGGMRVAGVKSALWWTSSLAWWPVLWGGRPRFHRTPKDDGTFVVGRRAARWTIDQWCALGGLVLAFAHAAFGAPIAATALALSAITLVTAPLVDRMLRRAAARARRQDRVGAMAASLDVHAVPGPPPLLAA